MQTFKCTCGNRLFFENSGCKQCGKQTGFVPQQMLIVDIQEAEHGVWTSAQLPDQRFRKCNNYLQHNICNWLIPVTDTSELCQACRLNKIIPDLAKAGNLTRWYRLERAKRRTLYNLYRIGLRVPSLKEQPDTGLEFCFKEDVKEYDPYTQELVTYERIMTGHDTGTITINIEEADHAIREAVRENMNEPYRTPLGHIRHETGHYFWDRLIDNTPHVNSFRQLFGDERHDYQKTLQSYYQSGPMPDWQDNFISAYASSHPWEDWAETWAHYLHITDTMETACDFGFMIEGCAISQPPTVTNGVVKTTGGYLSTTSFDAMLTDWLRLTIAMNALNRSMGLRDAYPFAVSKKVGDKLRYVHNLITGSLAISQPDVIA